MAKQRERRSSKKQPDHQTAAMLRARLPVQEGQQSSNGASAVARPRAQKHVLNIALCGLGRAAMGLLNREVLQMKAVRIVGAFDLLRDRSESLAHRLGSKVYESYAQLLADPEVELVVLATRSVEHVPMAIEALKAGKDVLVEKPAAMNLKQCDQLLKVAAKVAAEKRGGRLFVRHNRRFEPAFLHAKEIIAGGKLGEIHQVALRVHKYQKRNDWQTLKKFGGGQLLNWGPHVIDWALQFIDGPVADIWCDLKCVAAAGDAEDTIKLLIRGENGVVADIEISDAVALGQPAWVIYGSRGTLVIDGTNCTLRYLHRKIQVKLEADDSTPQTGVGYAPTKLEFVDETFPVAPKKQTTLFLELYKTLKRGAAFPVTLEQVRETMRIIDMARKGSRF